MVDDATSAATRKHDGPDNDEKLVYESGRDGKRIADEDDYEQDN